MNRLLLSIVAALIMAGNMQAQEITPADNQLWWGYFKGNEWRTGLGYQTTGTYDACINITGSNTVAKGKTIKAVRIYLRDTSHLSNLKVWLSEALPKTGEEADVLVQPVDMSTIVGGDMTDADGNQQFGMPNDIVLDTPYEMTGKGVYVGYSFDVDDVEDMANKTPLVTGFVSTNLHGLYVRAGQTLPELTDLHIFTYYGNLALQVLLEGDFANNALVPTKTQDKTVLANSSTNISVTLRHDGNKPVNNFAYTITSNGKTSDEKTIDLDNSFNQTGETFNVTLPYPADDESGEHTQTLTITKVNGQPNEAAKQTIDNLITTVPEAIRRRAVMEEFTGTGCGYCPRGMKAMEMLRETYGDDFIGIGIHQYNTDDAMYFPNYFRHGMNAAPGARLNRATERIDPKYGTDGTRFGIANEIGKIMADPAVADLQVSGTWNDDSTEIKAQVVITPSISVKNYEIAYAVVADDLIGEGRAWQQHNYYCNLTTEQQADPDLYVYGVGGEWGDEWFIDYPYQDVLIASSYAEGGANQAIYRGQLEAGKAKTATYTLALPTKASLRKAIRQSANEGKVAVVAMLINTRGIIDNAVKTYLPGLPAEVEAVKETGEARVTTCYSPDGRQLDSPRPGINILRMSDGSRRKVVVK